MEAAQQTVEPRLPPGPKGTFLLGSLPEQARAGMLEFYESLWRHHGDTVYFKLGPMPCVLFVKPDDVEHVLLQKKERYEKGIGMRKLKLMLGNGLFVSEGDFWRAQRKLMQPPFTPRGVVEFADCMLSCLDTMCDDWQQRAANGATLEVNSEMMHLAMDVVGSSMFGMSVRQEAKAAAEAFGFVLDYVGTRTITLFDVPLFVPTADNRRFKAARHTINTFIDELVRQRKRAGNERQDLLTRLLRAADADTGHTMSEQQLKDEVITLFFAGHETTAQALTWVWILLAEHPEKRDRLEAELAQVLGGRVPTIDDLARLEYTRAVVDEAMRVFPPIWMFVRQARVDDVVGGYRVPKGAMIMVSPYLTQRHPEWWVDPERFEPERFLGEARRSLHSCAYFPFGAGPRICIGNNFALLEMVLTVATAAQRFRLHRVNAEPIVPKALSTLRPSGPVQMRLEPR